MVEIFKSTKDKIDNPDITSLVEQVQHLLKQSQVEMFTRDRIFQSHFILLTFQSILCFQQDLLKRIELLEEKIS